MEIMIELNEESAQRLQQEASRRGLEVSEYARTLLENSLPPLTENDSGETLDKALAGLIGLVKSDGRRRWSENGGEKFTDYLVQKRKEGHL